MTVDPLFIGIGAAILAAVLTFFMPVSTHRVNQTLVAALIAILVFVAAFALFDLPIALGIGIVVSGLAILFRRVVAWVRKVLWHNVFRYTRRYYWYNRIGRALIGPAQRRRRRRSE